MTLVGSYSDVIDCEYYVNIKVYGWMFTYNMKRDILQHKLLDCLTMNYNNECESICIDY